MALSLHNIFREFFDAKFLGKGPDHGKVSAPAEVSQRLIDGGGDIHDVAKSIHGIHNILKYDQYDADNGLFYNDNSVAFCFEVLPQTGADSEMTNKLTQLFTPIPPGCGVQWCLFGSPLLDDQFQAYLDLRHVAVDNGRTSDFFGELAQRRVDYVSRSKGRPLFPSGNYVVKTMRLVFSVTRTGTYQDKRFVPRNVGVARDLAMPAKNIRPACVSIRRSRAD